MAELEKLLCTDSKVESLKKINAIIENGGGGGLDDKITNCLLEVPQRIKYTLENGTLTIKAGSVIIVPYGVTDKTDQYPVGSTFLNDNFKVYDTQFENGKFFVWAETQSDIIRASATSNVNTRVLCVVVSENTTSNNVTTASGDGSSLPTQQSYIYYNTTTNLFISKNSGVIQDYVVSLPIMITQSTEQYNVASISQVFNGMGYIGSTIWVDKGVKGLVPNGRNEDGTLKNIEFTTSKLVLHSDSLVDKNWIAQISESVLAVVAESNYFEQETEPTGVTGWTVWFNTIENRCYLKEIGNSSSSWTPQDFCNNQCVFTVSNGVITSIKIKPPFRAVGYSDRSTISGWGMPSNKYIDLALGASGTTYTAPANGYFVARGDAMEYVSFEGANPVSSSIFNANKSGWSSIYVPVRKGKSIIYYYTTSPNTQNHTLKFVYTEGEI